MNLQIQRTLVFETSAIPGYATSARGAPAGRLAGRLRGAGPWGRNPLGDAAKWRAYVTVSVKPAGTGVTVHVEFRPARQPPQSLQLPAGATVSDLLHATRQSPDATLVIRGPDPITEGEALRDGETLLLLSAFSGG